MKDLVLFLIVIVGTVFGFFGGFVVTVVTTAFVAKIEGVDLDMPTVACAGVGGAFLGALGLGARLMWEAFGRDWMQALQEFRSGRKTIIDD